MDNKLQETIVKISNEIDLKDKDFIINYGNKTREKTTDFSENIMKNIKTKDTGELGESLSKLALELQPLNNSNFKKGFLDKLIPSKFGNRIKQIQTDFNSVSTNVMSIAKSLDKHTDTLSDDNKNLKDYTVQLNNEYREYDIQIQSGQIALDNFRLELKNKQDNIDDNDLLANDEIQEMIENIDLFEKQLTDLRLGQMLCYTNGVQIKGIINSNTTLIQKIIQTKNTTIPMWKSQIAQALVLENQKNALVAQKNITDATNKLIVENGKNMKSNMINVVKQNNETVIDIEAIKQANNLILETIDEIGKINEENSLKRLKIDEELNNEKLRFEQQITQRLKNNSDILQSKETDKIQELLEDVK